MRYYSGMQAAADNTVSSYPWNHLLYPESSQGSAAKWGQLLILLPKLPISGKRHSEWPGKKLLPLLPKRAKVPLMPLSSCIVRVAKVTVGKKTEIRNICTVN
jgi:hypothetical protein